MALSNNYVRARIDEHTKMAATAALEEMGLSVSDAIRLLMFRVADERRLPFEIKAPNEKTLKAMAELKAGKGKRHKSVKSFMKAMNEDD